MSDTNGTEAATIDDGRPEEHLALRELLRGVTTAINERRWDDLDAVMHPNVMVTMIDQVTLRGPAAVREYAERKLGGVGSILGDLKVEAVPDAPAVLFGDTAVCTLSSSDRFVFHSGKELMVQDRYTVTLIKSGGAWKVVALHGGANAFNNPISYPMHRFLSAGLVVAGVGGLLLGWALKGRR